MTTFGALSAVFVAGLATYAFRAGLILTLADRALPASVERMLRNVGPAVLSALVVTLVAGADGVAGISLPEVAGIGTAAVTAWKTRNLIITLIVGMAAVWVVAAVA